MIRNDECSADNCTGELTVVSVYKLSVVGRTGILPGQSYKDPSCYLPKDKAVAPAG